MYNNAIIGLLNWWYLMNECADSAPAGRVKVREKNLSSKRSGADLESIARWLDHYSISEKVNPSSGGAETSAAAAAEKREAGYGSTPVGENLKIFQSS